MITWKKLFLYTTRKDGYICLQPQLWVKNGRWKAHLFLFFIATTQQTAVRPASQTTILDIPVWCM